MIPARGVTSLDGYRFLLVQDEERYGGIAQTDELLSLPELIR